MNTAKTDLPSIPRMTAWLTINRACNLRCNWCYAKMTKFRAEDSMDMSVVQKAIIFLKDLSLEAIILIGGEPTIHPNFLRIVDLVKQAGMKVYLVSNVVKFSDEKFLKDSLDAGIESITVSLKASNANDYKKFTFYD